MTLIGSRLRIGMVVVVPALAAGDDGDPYIVTAVVACFIVAVTEQMRKGISAPGHVPHQNGSDDHTPEPDAGTELQRLADRLPRSKADQEADREIGRRLRQTDQHD